jgi:hypothetical protein
VVDEEVLMVIIENGPPEDGCTSRDALRGSRLSTERTSLTLVSSKVVIELEDSESRSDIITALDVGAAR